MRMPCVPVWPADAAWQSTGNQLMYGPQRRRQVAGIQITKQLVGLLQSADQQQSSNFRIACMSCIDTVAVFLERHTRCIQSIRRPTQLSRGKCNFRLSYYHTLRERNDRSIQRWRPSSIQRLGLRASSPSCAITILEVPALARVITQRDLGSMLLTDHRPPAPMRCRGNQRIHRNPAKLVTPGALARR